MKIKVCNTDPRPHDIMEDGDRISISARIPLGTIIKFVQHKIESMTKYSYKSSIITSD